MRRRQFIQVAAGLAGTGLSPFPSAISRAAARATPLAVAVVGGGIVGASLAFHLARGGARVTLLEKTRPASGATEKSFVWINTVTTDAHGRRQRTANDGCIRGGHS